eukprot:gene268-890_t
MKTFCQYCYWLLKYSTNLLTMILRPASQGMTSPFLYKRCQSHEELTHHCLQCLIQLASLTGPVFQNQQMKVEYLSQLLHGFIQLMNRNHWTSLDAFGAASIVSRMVNVFTISVIASLHSDVLKPFLETLAALTCLFQDFTLRKDELDVDAKQFEEAVELLLDALVILITNSSSFPDGCFMSYTVQIFNSYIKTHLAMPDGIRNDANNESEADEIDCEVGEEDRMLYADELCDIGCISRLALSHVIPVLSNLIQSRTNLLIQLIGTVHAGNTIESADALYEDIHWLLLVATHVVTMDTTSEAASIPQEIIQHQMHVQESCSVNVELNLKFLIGLGQSSCDDHVDMFIVLMTRIFNLATIINKALMNNMAHIISPEIASDLLYFLQCWTTAYLFPKQSDDARLPACFESAFCESTSCGKQIVGLILDVVECHLTYLAAEQSVATDAAQLLLKLVQSDNRISVALEFPHLWRMAEQQSKLSSSAYRSLPPSVQRHLVHALMKVASHIKEPSLREKFLHEFLGGFRASYDRIIKHPEFDKIFQNEPVKQQLISLIETMRGLTLATDSTNVDMIFQFLLPFLQDILILLQKYSNCSDIVELIIEVFVDVVQTEIIYLDNEKSNTLCGLCVQLISNYSKYNLGRLRCLKTGEDESYNEILLLIHLLTHILSKDYLDFSGDAGEGTVSILNAIEAVFHGLYIIIPLMTAELLKFPKLSTEYFKLVTFVCECYPEKIETLPQDLFTTLTASLEMALLQYLFLFLYICDFLASYGPDIAKNSLEALFSISLHCFKNKGKQGLVPGQVDQALKHFLKVVFEYILSSNFDMDLIQPASETLLILICCNQMEYMTLAQALLSNQSDLGILQRLRNSFEDLTPSSSEIKIDKASKTKFRKALEKFLLNVKGFLCYK